MRCAAQVDATYTLCTVLTLESWGANEIHHFIRHSNSKEWDYAGAGAGSARCTVLHVIMKPEQVRKLCTAYVRTSDTELQTQWEKQLLLSLRKKWGECERRNGSA